MHPFSFSVQLLSVITDEKLPSSVWSQLLFVCDITLTDEELSDLEPLTWLAFTHMILWHDYMSWDKEAATYLEREEGGSNMSAVQVYMNMHGMDPKAAKEHVLVELGRIEDEYCETKDKYIAENAPQKHILHYIGLIEMVMAGNTLWHISSRRYNMSTDLPSREDVGKVNGAPLDLEAAVAAAKVQDTDSDEGYAEGSASDSGSGDGFTRCPSEVAIPIRRVSYAPDHFRLPGASSNRACQAFFHNQKTEYTTMEPADLSSSSKSKKREKGVSLTVPPCLWPAEKDEKTILAPYVYLSTQPSGGARDKLIDALNNWYFVPTEPLAIIRSIIRLIHNASLMLVLISSLDLIALQNGMTDLAQAGRHPRRLAREERGSKYPQGLWPEPNREFGQLCNGEMHGNCKTAVPGDRHLLSL